ncbi:DUF2333 family protein [Halomonas heilongjiangensis]|uniref:DUF2333 domain-containing protein n=1 Tax=Halomonas heilongjiangensis TaxID=1387883 RepID=A0A2N7TKK3_9GAMM|nr:DUF2333 family protein [Halomonas heilongjiangensis]PMR68658.1 DUF2333 domain-containing protein [Halomonas heilongjiangensis]PXX87610.1 hypothetical protein CR158_17550 [Halomonas heilongjiangensis]
MALTEKGAARRRRRTEALERPDYGWIWKPLLALVVIYLLVVVALGIWWSREPAAFDVEQATAEQRGEAASAPAARGAVTAATLMRVVSTLRDKPGGYLRNDIAPPGLWLDNMPNWELGALIQARDLARALPTMEEGDQPALAEVADRLGGDGRDWLYPSTEHRLEQALDALGDYLAALGEEGGAGFDAGAGLAAWLEQVGRRLDDLGARLSASVGNRERLRDLGIDAGELPSRTPWYRVDDIFFEARGTGWALLHLLEAVRRDQADVLERADALGEWELLVAELERTQRRLWSPMVLNGSGFGIFANHSLVMANHVIRARDLARELAGTLEAPPAGLAAPEAAEEEQPVEPPVEAVERSEDAGGESPPPALASPEEAREDEQAKEPEPLSEPTPEDEGGASEG